MWPGLLDRGPTTTEPDHHTPAISRRYRWYTGCNTFLRLRSLLLVATFLAVAAAAPDAHACALFNATDAPVRVLGADGATVAELGGRSANLYLGALANATLMRGAAALTLPCANGAAFVLDPRGAVRKLPPWFAVENRADRLVVTAPEKTVVRIDGVDHESTGTVEVIYDAAALARGSMDALHATHVEIPKAKVDVWIEADKAQLLAADLADVAKRPLEWSSLHAGPAPHPMLVLTCDMGTLVDGGACRRGGTVRALNDLERIGAAQLVAVVVTGTVPCPTCPRTGARRRLARTKVTVYEARTGAEVTGRLFDGPEPECPPGPTRTERVGAAPPAEPIDAWLGEL